MTLVRAAAKETALKLNVTRLPFFSCSEDNLNQDYSIYRGVRFSGVLLL